MKSAKPKNVIWYIETTIPELGKAYSLMSGNRTAQVLTLTFTFVTAENEAKVVKYSVMTTFEKFVELHKVMWNINNGLTKSHPYDSRP